MEQAVPYKKWRNPNPTRGGGNHVTALARVLQVSELTTCSSVAQK